MLDLELLPADVERPRVLCLGAHCDDVEIGCGATLLTLAAARDLEVTWVVFASTPERAAEARRAAASFLGEGPHRVEILEHRDGFLPYHGAQVKEDFERLKGEVDPHVVFTHTRDDLHQDHRLVQELTWNTFRDHLVLEYEIPKWDGDLGRPNTYVPVTEEIARRKTEILVDAYASQRGKRWFDPELFLSLMRLRGMECNASSGLAEAFHARKLRIAP